METSRTPKQGRGASPKWAVCGVGKLYTAAIAQRLAPMLVGKPYTAGNVANKSDYCNQNLLADSFWPPPLRLIRGVTEEIARKQTRCKNGKQNNRKIDSTATTMGLQVGSLLALECHWV